MAVIAIWTAANWVVCRSSYDEEEPAAGTFLLDDAREGPIREDDDAGLLDCGIVDHRGLHMAPWLAQECRVDLQLGGEAELDPKPQKMSLPPGHYHPSFLP